MTEKIPLHLRIAEVVHAHGRILTSEIEKLFSGSATGLAEAESAGLIRQDGYEGHLRSFVFDYYWVPGRNDLSLSVRSNQLAILRRAADQLAVDLLRHHYATLREAFLNSGGIITELEEWLYQDAAVTHDEWQLARDAERLKQPVPPPEPPKPERRPTQVPPKPKPWKRRD